MTSADLAYWAARAARGDACLTPTGRCRGCGREGWHVAEGAADGCPVCAAFLDWCGPA